MPLVNIISAVLEALPLVFMHQNKYQKQHFILKTAGNTPKIFPAFGRILSLIRGEFSRRGGGILPWSTIDTLWLRPPARVTTLFF